MELHLPERYKGKEKSIMVVGVLLILIPVVFAGMYAINTIRPQAQASCSAADIHVSRVSERAASVSFSTSCSVKAEVYCAAGRTGVQFLCGEDTVETLNHIITTDDVTLSSNVGYYIFIDTGAAKRALGFIPASTSSPTYGLNYESYNEQTMGSTREDTVFDPALDINQDGVINVMDKLEFYDDAK